MEGGIIPMKFKGKVALVTGASKGLGRAIALEFAREGAHVAILARSADLLQKLASEVETHGVRALPLCCDVTHSGDLAIAVNRAAEELGRLDILVNNVGVGLYSEIAKVPLQDFRFMMELNFWSMIVAIQTALPHMGRQREGTIINIASILGKIDYPWMGAYCASKHAMVSICNALRMELREKKINVLTVCPGRVDTQFQPNALKYRPLRNPHFSAIPLSAERVARQIVRGAWKHKREIVLPRAGWLLVALQHLWPQLSDRLAMSFTTR